MVAPANPLGGIVNSLPIESMVSKPLMAAVDAHTAMCLQLAEFIDKVGFIDAGGGGGAGGAGGKGGGGGKGGSGDKQIRMVDWKWSAPQWNSQGTTAELDADGKPTGKQLPPVKYEAQVPFISMVPLPALGVDKVTVDFELEVSTSDSSTSSTETEASVSGSVGFWWVKAKFSAKVTHKSEQTRKTDTRAKYSFHVEAAQHEPPEALMRMIDMVVDSVTKPKAA